MKVATRDAVIRGLLEEERRRSCEALQALLSKAEILPRGALNVRRKRVQGNEYFYHYIVRREGKRVVNRHVAEREVPELRQQIGERRKNREEIKIVKQRLSYLERLLR